jgi:hypothetical protein
VQQLDPKQFVNFGNRQQLKQLGFQQQSGQLIDKEKFMQLQQLEHLGNLHLKLQQHFIPLHVHAEQVFDFEFRLCRIFFRRFPVVMFSISWMNLHRWRM